MVSASVISYETKIPSSRIGAKSVLVYGAFLTALLYLLFSHTDSDAPLRQNANPISSYADIAKELEAANRDPRDAQIHFVDVGGKTFAPDTQQKFCRVYYIAQYLRYPHRILVGNDDKIVNNKDQLLAADQLPTAERLKQRNISAVYFVYDLGMIGPRMEVRPVR